jgi:hypothetical protein
MQSVMYISISSASYSKRRVENKSTQEEEKLVMYGVAVMCMPYHLMNVELLKQSIISFPLTTKEVGFTLYAFLLMHFPQRCRHQDMSSRPVSEPAGNHEAVYLRLMLEMTEESPASLTVCLGSRL